MKNRIKNFILLSGLLLLIISFSNCKKNSKEEPVPVENFTETEKLLHGGSEKTWKGIELIYGGNKITDSCYYAYRLKLLKDKTYQGKQPCTGKDSSGIYKISDNKLITNNKDTATILLLITDTLKLKSLSRWTIKQNDTIVQSGTTEVIYTYKALK